MLVTSFVVIGARFCAPLPFPLLLPNEAVSMLAPDGPIGGGTLLVAARTLPSVEPPPMLLGDTFAVGMPSVGGAAAGPP